MACREAIRAPFLYPHKILGGVLGREISSQPRTTTRTRRILSVGFSCGDNFAACRIDSRLPLSVADSFRHLFLEQRREHQ